jgi:choline transport protein
LKIPINALALVSVLSSLLALINIGSTTAFLAILSLATFALYISYTIPILFVLIRKLEGRPPNYGPFKLGRWGIPINAFALVWCIFTIIWLPFPVSLPVTKETMNYAAPVWGGFLVIALVDWFFSGHKRFRIPAGVDTDWLAAQKTEVRDEVITDEKLVL